MTETLSVQRNLELLGRYQYLEIQLMELMGSWAYTIMDPEIKIAFGRQMYQDAVHADLLGKRIPELKGRSAHFHVIPPSDGVVRVIEKVWNAVGDLKRMVGLYRILKPALIEAYRAHIAMAELPADEPTAYILRHIADEERDHCGWGERSISRLPADPLLRDWERDLTRELREAAPAASGGTVSFTGAGKGRGTYSFTKVHDYSFLPVRDSRWDIIADPGEFTEKNWSFDTREGKQHLLHDLLNSEFITVERMGRILADFPGIPWPMRLDMARQAWDEARHAEIVQRRLEELGGRVGMFKTSCWGWEQDVNRPDPLERLALSNMTFESESCKHLRDWIGKAKEGGDDRSVQLLEFLLADEVNHVLYGVHWIDELTRDDPERRKRVLAYPNRVLEAQHPVGVRFNETINAR
jgi:uncharacterized ferritin-like protein (DUF455 family)